MKDDILAEVRAAAAEAGRAEQARIDAEKQSREAAARAEAERAEARRKAEIAAALEAEERRQALVAESRQTLFTPPTPQLRVEPPASAPLFAEPAPVTALAPTGRGAVRFVAFGLPLLCMSAIIGALLYANRPVEPHALGPVVVAPPVVRVADAAEPVVGLRPEFAVHRAPQPLPKPRVREPKPRPRITNPGKPPLVIDLKFDGNTR